MHYRLVLRVALAVSALCLTAVITFATLSKPSVPAGTPIPTGAARDDAMAPGAALFAQHCARCHPAEEMVAQLRAAETVGAGGAALVAKLHRHGKSTDVEDWQIVAWLVASTP